MGNRLTGKIAIVTGGGRGVGREVSILLAEEGATVVVNDLGCSLDGVGQSQDPADDVVERIRSTGGVAIANYDDVAEMTGGESVVHKALDKFGRLDVLVNSASVRIDRLIHEMSPEQFDLVLRNNLKGTFTPTKYASIWFRKQRGGRIVNMINGAGLGVIGSANFSMASEAIVGLTRSVARDLGKYGVTCNAISPIAKTRLFPDGESGSGPGEGILFGSPDKWESIGKFGDPGNVAPLTALLCTDILPNVNGRVFGASGGSVWLYSEPIIESSIHKWGTFTIDEIDGLLAGLNYLDATG